MIVLPTDNSGTKQDRFDRIAPDITDRCKAIYMFLDLSSKNDNGMPKKNFIATGSVIIGVLTVLGVSQQEIQDACDLGFWIDCGEDQRYK